MTVFWADRVSEKLSDRRWMTAVILLIAVLMTVKYFPGFENIPAYAGNAFQSIYPDAFAGDPYMGPEKPLTARPLQLSLIYAVIHFTGEIWLDDRFTALVYAGLVSAALLGVDRTAAHLGLADPLARLVVLLFFMKDHRIYDTNLLAHHHGLNHYAFAVPLMIWLFYAVIAKKGWPLILALSAVLALVSVRAAGGAIFAALCAQMWCGTARDRAVVAALFASAAAAAYAGLYYIFPVPEAVRLEMWDAVREREHIIANPWHEPGASSVLKNGLWLALTGAGLWAAVRSGPQFRAAGAVLGAGLIIWLASGLYINAAPDALKQPLLLGFAPSRTLGWTQNIAFIVITAAVLMRAEARRTPAALAGAVLIPAGLYLTGPGDLALWSGLLVVSAAVVLSAAALRMRSASPEFVLAGLAARPAAAAAAVLAVSAAVVYADRAVKNWPYWRTWAAHGVYGWSTSAVWIGVDDYIRNNTPAGASVLAYSFRQNGALEADRSLGVRTGRAIPVPEDYTSITDPGMFERTAAQRALLAEIAADIQARRAAAARAGIGRLPLVPDYLVFPASAAAGLDWGALGYAPETEVREFIIARRPHRGGE